MGEAGRYDWAEIVMPKLETIEIISLASIFVYISLWEYMMIMYKLIPQLSYKMGYNIFSVLQWPFIAIAFINIFGWLNG